MDSTKVSPANYNSTKVSDLELDAKVVDVEPAAEAGIILKHVEHFLAVACQDDSTVAASVAIELLDHSIENIAAVDVVLSLRIENVGLIYQQDLALSFIEDSLGSRGSASFVIASKVGGRDRDKVAIAEISQLLEQRWV